MALETREKILVASLELFSARGYAAVGTKAIAEAAGVNEVTVFRSFGTKEKLWLEVFRRFVVRPETSFLLANTVGNAETDLVLVAKAIVELLKSNIKLLSMSHMDMAQFPEVHEELRTQPPRMIELLKTHLAPLEGALGASAEVVARTLVDTIFGVAIHLQTMGKAPSEGSLDQWMEDFLPLFLRGAIRS